MGHKKKVTKLNNHGTIGVSIPSDAVGPNGETIEKGDYVSFEITGVEKAEDAEGGE
ncbi:hypothetical protein G3I44_14100 [Halogeometricum borinquense]|uniref:Uncharacterized protein n=1 Tax=Halogeometricum borinquense TaxID=60847 RepID=A0A6C0UN48_9EURY|nr:hypothetical protein [Halogeometricum borinquense]QIB75319.1 hypothetical protein G3I44_14100 [Halogeometricum borinquense]